MAAADGARPEGHSFWDKTAVPGKDTIGFRPLISRKCQLNAGQIFRPKDEHCGIWHSPPNKACHSSFGEKGTTASVNCYGDFLQSCQYLGTGHSGLFSLDQPLTDEPYMVHSRADRLDTFSKEANLGPSMHGLLLADFFWPGYPLEVKWVNWRWPRYEYSTVSPKVDVSIQWMVHDGIVLQQLVLENTGDEPVEVDYTLDTDMLIRDLDYLDPSYSFNEDESDGPAYKHVSGPNGYGHVCVHRLVMPDPKENSDEQPPQQVKDYIHNDPRLDPVAQTGAQRHEHMETVIGDKQQVDRPKSSTAAEAQCDSRDVRDGASSVQHYTPLPTGLHSVAAVTTLFIDGKAVEMPDASIFSRGHALEGHSLTEFVVAYKLVPLPASEIHWENFLITAEEADVIEFLHVESNNLWGSENNFPLCSLGLSMVDLHDTMRNTTGRKLAGNKENEDFDGVESNSSGNMAVPGNKKPETSRENKREGDTRASVDAESTSNPNDNTQTRWNSKQEAISFPSGPPSNSSPKSHIEYLAWRHLEHILSVCAIPLSIPSLKTPDKRRRSPADNTSVALTCGDMSGHRISTSASFFAFRFLIDVARRLEHSGIKTPYVTTLLERIKAVCRGHISWLKEVITVDGRLLKSGCFAANYWPTGRIMPPAESSDTWQPRDAITDTPFQILKMADYHSFYNKGGGRKRKEDDRGRLVEDVKNRRMEDDEETVHSLLGKIRESWLRELNKLDKRASFAWPHARDEGINTFRLDDHFWVWKALKSLEDLGFSGNQPLLKPVEDEKSDTTASETKKKEEFARVAKRLLSGDVQRGILQRFTTENDVSRRRMLAVTRSARETRFLFHARDTALFYGYDHGFFLPGSSFHELWENTIEAQLYHEENKEAGWGNAIRYALGIMVGTRGHCLNKQSPAGMVKSCVEVLICSSSHNGFFPGQLDEATKKPALFYGEEDRDFYHHANFEINHILLTHARHIDTLFQETTAVPQKQTRLDNKGKSRLSNEDEFLLHLFSELAEMLVGLMEQPKRQKMLLDPPAGKQNFDPGLKRPEITQRLESRRSLTMKKVIPFNNLIDARSITSFEEEWLYSYPEFLSTEEVDLVQQINVLLKSDQPNSDIIGGIIAQTLQKYRGSNRDFSLPLVMGVCIADTPKQKYLGRREKRQFEENPFAHHGTHYYVDGLGRMLLDTGQSPMDLCSQLGAARTAENAKKRFIWLPHAQAEIALVCWMASPEKEKPALSLFFDRHSKYENHVWDDTTMVLNTWQTELHLSFYVLVDTFAAAYQRCGLPIDSRDPFPGSSRKEIWRASVGFRFDGDIFDRYWTCHFIEHIPSSYPFRGRTLPFTSPDRHTDKQWRQRKVLELHLLDRILATILDSSRKILDQIAKELGVNVTLSSSVLNSDIYLSSKDDSQKFEQLLQIMDDDITSVLHTLQKWSTREKDRGEEKPRWTRNDERKYRGIINKLQGSTERHIRDLEIRRDNVRKLKETLTTRREKARQDLEFHWNENIRYFTYVTVIFLPLGFASSFYSMGGPPAHDLIIALVEFSVAALAVTVVLLFSAKWILSAAKELPAGALKRATEKSLLVGGHQRAKPDEQRKAGKEQKSGTEVPGQKTKGQEDLHGAFGSPASFWLAYIFVEIPALRVLRAVTAMRRGKVSGAAAADVALGVIFMPVFGTSCLLRIVAYNILDLFRNISTYFEKLLASMKHNPVSSPVGDDGEGEEDEESFLRRFHKIKDVPQSFRPLRSHKKSGGTGEITASKDAKPPRNENVPG